MLEYKIEKVRKLRWWERLAEYRDYHVTVRYKTHVWKFRAWSGDSCEKDYLIRSIDNMVKEKVGELTRKNTDFSNLSGTTVKHEKK